MNLPRNAYARHLARQAGRLFAQHREAVFTSRPYLADELFAQYQDAKFWAHRWRRVPWCPVALGETVAAGGLQVDVLAVVVKLFLLPVVAGCATVALMYLGVLVDRAYVPPPPCVEVPNDP